MSKKEKEEKRREQSDRLAESIKEQERRREEIKFQEEWSKRIDIAREGRVAYEGEDPVTAVLNYKKILQLTARRYNVPLEGLHPNLFDEKVRISESLLLSAITFDLAKIVERLEGEAARKDMMTYLRLFVLFSRDMPFEVIAMSTVRKYMMYTHGLKNRAAFEEAYKALRKNRCFVASVAFDNESAPELLRLRKFRDEVLKEYFLGRIFTEFYYYTGPVAAFLVKKIPGASAFTRACLRGVLRRLN